MANYRILYRAAVLGLAFGLCLPAMPAGATTFTGQNGTIAFSRSNTIWTISMQGKQAEMLRKNAHTPVWSPDGRKIVFVAKSWRGSQLYSMNADSSNQKRLTSSWKYTNHSPAWAPDGSKIAFVRENHKHSAIFTVKANGSAETNVTGWTSAASYGSPSWSPGNKLVYEKYSDSQNELFIMDLYSGNAEELVTLSDAIRSEVTWSPNGERILYRDSSNEVYTIRPDGNERTVISDGDSYSASWSPDGTKIAFLEELDGEAISISEENGNVVQIPINKGHYQEIGPPIWSPDGTTLIFTMARGVGKGRVCDIFSLNIEGSNTLTLLAHREGNELNWQAQP